MNDKLSDIGKLNLSETMHLARSAERSMQASMDQAYKATQDEYERKRKTQDATIQLAHQSQEQVDLLHHQVNMVTQQNVLLGQNYYTLKQLYEIQQKDYEEAKTELKRSKRFNIIMLIITIVAMFGAVSPIISWLVSL